MKILVTGDRNFTARSPILNALRFLPKDTIIIHGTARGADTIADVEAKALGLERRPYPALWANEGRSAGLRRNIRMLDTEHPDLVIAFHGDIEQSRGTRHCIIEAQQRGIPVILITEASQK